MTMELNIYVFYGLLEAVLVLLVATIFLYRRARLYKPHYQAKVHPDRFIRRYIKKALEETRAHAKSFVAGVKKGESQAIIRQRNLVARLNWLVLERDFLTSKTPDDIYWDDMNNRINRLLDQWDLAGIISSPPDAQAISKTLTGSADDGDGVVSALQKKITEQKARIKYLEKHVRQLDSYKNMFEKLQGTYDSLKKTYKNMKRQLFDLQIEADQAEKLKEIIQEHENTESTMEKRIEDIATSKDRLNDELAQLEAAYVRQMEQIDDLKNEPKNFNLSEIELGEDLLKVKEIKEEQADIFRKLRSFIHGMRIDVDQKMEFEEYTGELENQAEQIVTCMHVLELENERLEKEIKELRT